jgi:hypothetical protein
MANQKIYIGAWFQRTMLHLSEVYDFLRGMDSQLELEGNRSLEYKKNLRISSVEIRMDYLEHVYFENKDGINVKIYEDGLIILSSGYSQISDDMKKIKRYYEEKLSPAISYIFSLGAPIPKELANIKNIYPFFVILDQARSTEILDLLDSFKQEKYFVIKGQSFEVHRGDKLYVINNISEKTENIEYFIGEQIFIREFKAQMHRYLNLHRIIWEKIADIKERGELKGQDIDNLKNKIESYYKTINLIETRINQMGTYLKTREKISQGNEHFSKNLDIYHYKYETLADTLEYIKNLWQMTKNYVDSAHKLFTDLLTESTGKSIRDLTIVSSIMMVSTLINLLTAKKPQFTLTGITYLISLILVGVISNKLINLVYMRRKYKIKDVAIDKDIK